MARRKISAGAALAQALTASDPRYQPWIDAAQIPLPRGKVTLTPAPSDMGVGKYGGTNPNIPEIFLGPGGTIDSKDPMRDPKHTLYHELGHVLWARTQPWQRKVFQKIMHDPRDPDALPPGGYPMGYSTPEERFAEAVNLTASRPKLQKRRPGASSEWYDFKVNSPKTEKRLRRLMFQINGGTGG